jgi:phage shock protein PspC (stress-responsive transcriptional regulator)
MKKTISIHLMGSNFLVEEDAYELLSDYLRRLKQSLGNSSDSKEIYDDVELRISELAGLKINDKKQVVTLEEIEEIIQTLGEPEDFIESEEETISDTKQTQEKTSSERRFFRDEKNGSIAGVCAGLAAYFNIDVVIVRILFVLFAIFGAFGIPIYIILWVVIPSAKTSKDRLEMQGRPITVENLKEEFESAGEKIKKSSQRFESELKDKNSPIRQRISSIARVLSIVFGVGFFLASSAILIFLIVSNLFQFSVFPIDVNGANLSFQEVTDLVFVDSSNGNYIWLASNLVLLAIGISFLLLAIRLLFGIKKKWFKYANMALTLFVIVNVSILFYQGMRIGADYAVFGQTEKVVGDFSGPHLSIHALGTGKEVDNDFVLLDNEQIIHDGIDFQYKESIDTSFHVYAYYSARGSDRKMAKDRSKEIVHEIYMDSTGLKLSPIYTFHKKNKLRNQEVEIHIHVPKQGKVLFQNHIIDHTNLMDTGSLEEDGVYEHDRY